MSDVLDLATARARGIDLPADDTVAQSVLDQTEAELARELGGPLVGPRTETFFTGLASGGKLSLSRYTDSVTIEDNGVAVPTTQYRLIDRGSAIALDYFASVWWWTGPYVEVTYTPNDELEVAAVAYQLLALSSSPAIAAGVLQSERIGDYEYQLASSATAAGAAAVANRRALARSLIPKRDALYSLNPIRPDFPSRNTTINRGEWPV